MTASELEQTYFVQDLPDLKVAANGQRTVFFRFYASDGPMIAIIYNNVLLNSFSETYYPDADGYITIRNLAETAKAYVSPKALSSINYVNPVQTWEHPYIKMTIEVRDPETVNQVYNQFTTFIYYANVRMGVAPTACRSFLSQYTTRRVLPWQPLLFSHVMFSDCSTKMVVAYTDAEGAQHRAEYTFNLTSVNNSYILNYAMTVATIATLLEIPATGIYSVDVFLSENGTVKDVISFEIDRDFHRQAIGFCFTNCFGVPETEVLTGKDVRSDKMESEYSFVSNLYKKVHTELVEEHKVCSGFIQETAYKSLLDMVRSDKVTLLQQDGSLGEEVVITETDFSEDRPHKAPNSVYLTYRVADRNQQKFTRRTTLPVRIFDQTFDESFE